MYLGQAMGICPGLMNFQTFDTSGTPYSSISKHRSIMYLSMYVICKAQIHFISNLLLGSLISVEKWVTQILALKTQELKMHLKIFFFMGKTQKQY